MPRYRHIIWDWNGTLLDDTAVVVEVMNGLLRARRLASLSIERYREIFTFPVRDYYRAAGFDLEAEPFALLAAEWVDGFSARWRNASIREGAHAALRGLAARGLTQSLLSAAEKELLRTQAAYFGLIAAFDDLVGIDDHHAETKLEHGRRWLAASAIDPAAVLLVGDTTHDYDVGKSLGVDTVLFSGGHQAPDRLETCGVPVVDSLGQVVELIDSGSR
jgi:phosphoglycolate phosphatase